MDFVKQIVKSLVEEEGCLADEQPFYFYNGKYINILTEENFESLPKNGIIVVTEFLDEYSVN